MNTIYRIMLVMALILMVPIANAATKTEHYGFTFMSSYDDCIKVIDKDYGVSFTTANRPKPLSKIESPEISFQATFDDIEQTNNTLRFTPKSKRLYEISHFIIPTGDKVNFVATAGRLILMLTNKYGSPKRLQIDPKVDKHIITQEWLKDGLKVTATIWQDMRDVPNSVIITYASIIALNLDEKERRLLESNLSKDL